MNFLQDKNILIKKGLPFSLFTIALYFPLFLHLGGDALGMWDESLFALRAFYLSHYNEYLINFNQIEPLWNHPNTKPPLFTFIQALFFKLFGYNELSLRLPVAITVLLMLFFLVYLARKQFGKPGIGYFAALILVTSPGFIHRHVARTGDHDAVLAFWMLLVFIYFYKLITETENQKKYIWIVALFLTAAVLTKSVAGLFPLPALLLFAIYKRKLKDLVFSWHTWGAIGMFLLLVGSFYFYQEWKSPGFLQSVWQEDMGGRYSGESHGHNHPWYFYLELLYKTDFIPWLFFIPFSIVILFTTAGKKYRDFSLYLLFCSVCILIIISASGTKCEWYHAGIFPLLALLVAIGINWLYEAFLQNTNKENKRIKLLVPAFFVVLIYTLPYIRIIDKINYPEKAWIEEQFGEYMNIVGHRFDYTVSPGRLNICLIFYTEVATKIEGRNVQLKYRSEDFNVGEVVMCSRYTSWAEKKYTFKIVDKFKDLNLIEITGLKK
ncbi:MAG: glycosyltransferase family 39 protein [Bacteroidales bacterium]|nr:glycosyltransferase family 39 protein [Bacteroidales bacterium]